MATPAKWYVEVDGQTMPASGAPLLAMTPHGHFTVMQVRGGGARGLDLHLDRLDHANRELYGTPLDGALVRGRIRAALATAGPDATARVVAVGPAAGNADPGRLVVALGPPGEVSLSPLRLLSVPYVRPFPHLKHLGTFGQTQYGRLARGRGFDEALLTGPDGTITEGATTNVGFRSAGALVWPAAPALRGVTMALLERALGTGRAPVRLDGLAGFDAAVATNSRGVAAIATIDDHRFTGSAAFAADLRHVYDEVPFDQI